MKKLLFILAMLVMGTASHGEQRVVEGTPATNDVYTITITAPALLLSIENDITAASETNSFTITYLSKDGTTFTYATAVADQIAGAETVSFYNYDADSSTGNTVWLQKGDTLYLTGNDGSQTDSTNVEYRVVFDIDRSR
jgi:hypothetical protein